MLELGVRKLRWLSPLIQSLRSSRLHLSLNVTRLTKLKFQFCHDGERKVLRPRLPPSGSELASGLPCGVKGVTKAPPMSGLVKVRKLSVTGSLTKTPFGLQSGLAPPAVPRPSVSTAVRIVKGIPDWK